MKWNWLIVMRNFHGIVFVYKAMVTAVLFVALGLQGCGPAREGSIISAGKIIKFGEKAEQIYPQDWEIRIVSPRPGSMFKPDEEIICEYTIDANCEENLPSSHSAVIENRSIQYSTGGVAELAGKLSETQYLFRTKIRCPVRVGKYHLAVSATELWWQQDAEGVIEAGPKLIRDRSESIDVGVRR